MNVLKRVEKPWTEEEIQYLVRNLEMGYTYSQIAEGLNRPRNAVAGKIRRLRGIPDKPKVRAAKPRQEAARSAWIRNGERQDQVAELLAENFTFPDIAEELGITENAVKMAFRKICYRLGPQAC